jgi:hypothetical protein
VSSAEQAVSDRMTDYTKLSDEDLERILKENLVDVPQRLQAKEEIERRRTQREEARKWSRGEKWTLVGVIIAVLTLFVCAAVVPEVRQFFHLDKLTEPTSAPKQSTENAALSTATHIGQQPNLNHVKSVTKAVVHKPAPQPTVTGVWTSPNETPQVFYEFLPEGKVSERRLLSDPPDVEQSETWYQTGDTMHIRFVGAAVTLGYEGKIKGDHILGSVRVGQSLIPGWRLERLTDPEQRKQNADQNKPADPLSGIWVDPTVLAGGKPMFYEFLSEGRVKIRYGLNGQSTLASNVTWYLAGNAFRMILSVDGSNTNGDLYDGTLSGDAIEGTMRDLKSGVQRAWKLKKVTEP